MKIYKISILKIHPVSIEIRSADNHRVNLTRAVAENAWLSGMAVNAPSRAGYAKAVSDNN